jgi:tetratricopeptide (TPR) repeat protein
MAGLLALAPSFAFSASHLEMARQLAKGGSAQAAIPEYEAALEESPREPALWAELGEARLTSGQPKLAVKDFQKALSFDPGREKAQRGLAQALETSGETNRAMLEWRRVAASASPEGKLEAETHIGKLLKQLGLDVPVVAAKPAATVSKSAKPEATKHEAPKKPTAEVKEGHNSAKAPESDKDPAYRKGLEEYHAGKKDAALEEFRKALQKRPGHPGAYLHAGIIRFEKNDAEKARFNLSRANHPFYKAQSLYWLARVDEKAGKKSQAMNGYKKALELGLDTDLAADAKKRLGTESAPAAAHAKENPHPAAPEAHPAAAQPSAPILHELSPAALPDTVRRLYSWNAPWVPFPALDPKDPATAQYSEAGEKRKTKKSDDALEVLRQIQVKHPNSTAAQTALLATAVVQYDMGLYDNAIASSAAFLKDSPKSDLTPQAQFLTALAQLRAGKSKDAVDVLTRMGTRSTGFPSESQRLSALAQGQSLTGKRTEAASTLRAAFAQESNTDQKRALALRTYREYQAIRAGAQALPLLQEALKTCDKSEACQRISVAKADLSFQSGGGKAALPDYQKIVATWPESPDAAWSRYQIGNCQQQLGKNDLAALAWKEAAQSNSYWGQQAKFRLEELAWRNQSGSRP